MERKKETVRTIRARKGGAPLCALTATDAVTARLVDEAGIDLILVGDSLANTVLGYENTLPVTLAQMLHHSAAVARGVRWALIVGDMPFLSYQGRLDDAVINAGRFLKEGGADGVKIEGGAHRAPLVRALVENGIPVMGHIGLLPQSVKASGGYRVAGRGAEAAEELVGSARSLEEAGAFCLVLEGMPAETAQVVTGAVGIPTIGIGAGPDCDGQILVVHDMLGLSGPSVPRFVKQYDRLGERMRDAFGRYRAEVLDRTFPGPEHSYT